MSNLIYTLNQPITVNGVKHTDIEINVDSFTARDALKLFNEFKRENAKTNISSIIDAFLNVDFHLFFLNRFAKVGDNDFTRDYLDLMTPSDLATLSAQVASFLTTSDWLDLKQKD